jgi:hypothetical protein
MREILTHNAGLGIGGRRLSGGGLSLQGSESCFSGVMGELQPCCFVSSHKKQPMSFIYLVDESAKLLTAA